jgi:hypothetical protein
MKKTKPDRSSTFIPLASSAHEPLLAAQDSGGQASGQDVFRVPDTEMSINIGAPELMHTEAQQEVWISVKASVTTRNEQGQFETAGGRLEGAHIAVGGKPKEFLRGLGQLIATRTAEEMSNAVTDAITSLLSEATAATMELLKSARDRQRSDGAGEVIEMKAAKEQREVLSTAAKSTVENINKRQRWQTDARIRRMMRTPEAQPGRKCKFERDELSKIVIQSLLALPDYKWTVKGVAIYMEGKWGEPSSSGALTQWLYHRGLKFKNLVREAKDAKYNPAQEPVSSPPNGQNL